MFSHSRMSAGREFQVDGSATEKARRASSVCMWGTTSSGAADEHAPPRTPRWCMGLYELAERLCVFGRLCVDVTIGTSMVILLFDCFWRLVHCWYQQCTNRQKQSKTVKRQSKMTIGVPIVTCLHRVRRIHKARWDTCTLDWLWSAPCESVEPLYNRWPASSLEASVSSKAVVWRGCQCDCKNMSQLILYLEHVSLAHARLAVTEKSHFDSGRTTKILSHVAFKDRHMKFRNSNAECTEIKPNNGWVHPCRSDWTGSIRVGLHFLNFLPVGWVWKVQKAYSFNHTSSKQARLCMTVAAAHPRVVLSFCHTVTAQVDSDIDAHWLALFCV